MKKLFFCLMMVFAVSLAAFSQTDGSLQGKYLTEAYNTKSADGMIQVTYTFTGDSLYIDAYPSGCGITAMSLERTTRDYKATEVVYKADNQDEIAFIKIYHLEFLPCLWDKHSLAVYRDGSVVDIIRLFP